jgi:glycine/D-amino acid oxidase-like deaminating enzyme
VIVGAGIVGTLAAARVARRRPDWRVLLVDRGMVGGGATRHSAALCLPFGRDEGHRRMERESDRFYRELRAERPGLPIRDLPCFVVAREGSLEEVRTRCTTRLRETPAATVPGLSLAADERLLEVDGASYGLPESVIAALRPTEVWEGVEITAVRPRGDGVELAAGDGRAIAAGRALLAPGPWIAEGPASGLARGAGVRVKKVVALHLDICPGPDDPVIYFFDVDAFLLPLVERGHWLFSFTCQVWDVSPDAPHRITEEDRRQGLAVLSRYRPEWAERCVGGRVFCDAYGPKWVPVVAAAPDAPRIVLATAGSGAGYRLGPAIARQALDALISGACS